MAQASHEPQARPVFRVLAGVLFVLAAASVLISLTLALVTREWRPLSVLAATVVPTYWFWRIARRGHM